VSDTQKPAILLCTHMLAARNLRSWLLVSWSAATMVTPLQSLRQMDTALFPLAKEYLSVASIPDTSLYLATCNSSSSTSPVLGSPPYEKLPNGGCRCPTATTRPWPSDCTFPDGTPFQGNMTSSPADRLRMVLNSQPLKVWKERYVWRHPYETLSFFGITAGMTVVEADPGSLWYSRILKQYLGDSGKLIGMDYPPPFGMAGAWGYSNFTVDFPARVQHHFGTCGAAIAAFQSNYMPVSLYGTADVVLLIRIIHDFPYFTHLFHVPWEPVLSKFLHDCFLILKRDGRLAVIDHDAGPLKPDGWIFNGYLSKRFVVKQLRRAGFHLDASSKINENPRDVPGINDTVWRLAPTYNRGRIPEIAWIGESSRMTLIFCKST